MYLCILFGKKTRKDKGKTDGDSIIASKIWHLGISEEGKPYINQGFWDSISDILGYQFINID